MTRHYPDLGSTGDWSCRVGNLSQLIGSTTQIWVMTILGDPGAVSRAVRKGATKVFNHGRKSPWVPTLTGPFPTVKGILAPNWGQKNALYYCAQSANSFARVLFVSLYTTSIILPPLPDSFTKLSSPETKELPMSRKTFWMLSARAIHFALRKFCFWRITMYRK